MSGAKRWEEPQAKEEELCLAEQSPCAGNWPRQRAWAPPGPLNSAATSTGQEKNIGSGMQREWAVTWPKWTLTVNGC